MELIFTIGAFILALGILIVFHEFGHYFVARLAGVKVLRFSVGFGMPLWSRTMGSDGTEWVVAAFPFGGYVKMLDEREGEVDPAERHRAFNCQSVWRRIAIVAAGPIANFVLAVVFYWILFVSGVPGLRPVLADPPENTPAAYAQLMSGDLVVKVGDAAVQTWQELRWELLDHAVRKDIVTLELRDEQDQIRLEQLDLSTIGPDDLDADLLRKIGIGRFNAPIAPVIGELSDDGPAERDGLKSGDRIGAVDGKSVARWGDVVAAVRSAPGRPVKFDVERDGALLSVTVQTDTIDDGRTPIGRIGAAPEFDEAQMQRLITQVRYAPGEALYRATAKMGEVSLFTLRMLGRMVIGDVSLKNLSGPITIADYAGQSAKVGWLAYLNFLALISISLGVLNLLPVPILDGGHLMYYLVEIAKGSPVSDRALDIGQRIGLALLLTLMAFAIYNDISRLFGG